MKKFWDEMMNWLPIVWGIIISFIITFGGLALAIWCIKWFLTAVGVM